MKTSVTQALLITSWLVLESSKWGREMVRLLSRQRYLLPIAAKSEDPRSIPWSPHGIVSFLRLKFTGSVSSRTELFFLLDAV